VKTDQAHVMGQRHPAQGDVVALDGGAATDGAHIGEQVRMAQFNALGLAGRAGGKLDQRRLIGLRCVLNTGHFDVLYVLQQAQTPPEKGLAAEVPFQALVQLPFAEQPGALQASSHTRDLLKRRRLYSGRQRHRDQTAQLARPEGLDESTVVAHEQNQRVPGLQTATLQPAQQAPGALQQRAVADHGPAPATVHEFDTEPGFGGTRQQSGERIRFRHLRAPGA